MNHGLWTKGVVMFSTKKIVSVASVATVSMILVAGPALSAAAAPPQGVLSTGVSTHAFESIEVGASSEPITVSISYEGSRQGNSAKLVFDMEGEHSDDFSITDTTCKAPLKSGESCSISVMFHPTDRGARSGTLEIQSIRADSQVADATIALTGLGHRGLGAPEPSLTFTTTQYPCEGSGGTCFGYVGGTGLPPNVTYLLNINNGEQVIQTDPTDADGNLNWNANLPCLDDATGLPITYRAIDVQWGSESSNEITNYNCVT
jgi:hypothetical protein